MLHGHRCRFYWRKMRKGLLLSVLVLLIAAFPLFATNYTVASASEITTVMANAQPGDTLFMKKGVWKDQLIRFVGNGTENAPIVLKAEEEGFVFITGESYLRIAGQYLVVDGLHFVNGESPSGAVIEFRSGSAYMAKNCRLTNTAIIDYNPASINTDYKWISLYGQYNRVDHCYLTGKNHSGTTLVVWMDAEPDYHLIDSNYFGARPDLGFNGGETIRIGTSDWSLYESGCTVEYNLFEKCDGETEIISNKSCYNIYRYNTFLESKGTLTLRHGNNCDVYSNFFFGNGVSSTGGIRIIGEDHKVYNNYLQDLDGEGYRAAICFVRGVENSPLNRYYQVKRAEVVNNTIVNCDEPFAIGYGSSSDQTLPPVDIKISNNAVRAGVEIIDVYMEPVNPFYSSNIFYDGAVGIDPIPSGITVEDPKLELAADGLYRPVAGSPLIDAGDESYDYVSLDFEGQPRNNIDIGADEVSGAQAIVIPVDSSVVGVKWGYIPEIPKLIRYVAAGVDSLKNAVENAQPGTLIKLVTDGGEYSNSSEIVINKEIYIEIDETVTTNPVIKNTSSSSENSIFTINQGGNLELRGLLIDGSDSKYIVKTDVAGFSSVYNLTIDNCEIYGVGENGDGNIFRAFPGTKANRITVKNSKIYDCPGVAFKLDDETFGSGNYNANYVIISNSTFYNIGKEVVSASAGDNVPFTPGPKVIVDHATFYNCGTTGTPTINPLEADSSVVKNSLFVNCSVGSDAVRLYGLGSTIEYSSLYNSGGYVLTRNAKVGYKVFDYDPGFADAVNYDFTLAADSPVLMRGKGKTAYGDTRWGTNTATKYPLDVLVSGPGSVEITPSNEYRIYDAAASVQVTATAETGFELKEFSGDINTSDNPVSVTMFGAIEFTATFDVMNGVSDNSEIPVTYNLHQNYPNPFNPSTRVKFEIPEAGVVNLSMYNMLGQKINTVTEGDFPAGVYNINISASGLSSGIYLLEMKVNDYRSVIKMNLLR